VLLSGGWLEGQKTKISFFARGERIASWLIMDLVAESTTSVGHGHD
jgi:hypothetical protein